MIVGFFLKYTLMLSALLVFGLCAGVGFVATIHEKDFLHKGLGLLLFISSAIILSKLFENFSF